MSVSETFGFGETSERLHEPLVCCIVAINNNYQDISLQSMPGPSVQEGMKYITTNALPSMLFSTCNLK